MKLDRKKLLTALNKVKPGLASSEVIEQSTSFIFRAGRIITYNDEVAASTPFDMGKIEGAVGASELLALLSKIKEDEISVKVDQGELVLEGRKITAGIPLIEEINLPILSFEPKEGFFSLPDKFLDGVAVCLFSAAKESVSPVLSNVHMEGSFIESCDNFRLTRFDLGEDTEDNILVPLKASRYISQTSVDKYGEEGGWLFFLEEKTGFVIAARTYEDEYPDLGGLLEVKKAEEIKMPKELSEVLERSGIFASSDDRSYDLVDVEVEDNWIVIRSENDRGWIEEKIRTKTKGAKFIFSVNPSILRDILKITDTAHITDRVIKFNAPDFEHVVTLIQPEK